MFGQASFFCRHKSGTRYIDYMSSFYKERIPHAAGTEIQRVYRGFKGRLRAKARRNVFKSDLGREAAAMTIERIFRGHKVSLAKPSQARRCFYLKHVFDARAVS